MRIGIVGIESSHVDHFIRHLNIEHRFGGVRVTALVGGDSARVDHLCATGAIGQVVDSAADLIGLVDAAIVSGRDGASHPSDAVDLLEAGISTFVDKPFATTSDAARSMIDAAHRGNSLVFSTSPLRTVPEMLPLVSGLDRDGPYDVVRVTGPADPESPHSGLAFYGIHLIEIGLSLCQPSTPTCLAVHTTRRMITASAAVGRTELTLDFRVPEESGAAIPFQVEALRHGLTTRVTLTRGPDLHVPTLDSLVGMLHTGRQPRPYADLLRSVALLEDIRSAL